MTIENCKKLLNSGNYEDVLIATTWIASKGREAKQIIRELEGATPKEKHEEKDSYTYCVPLAEINMEIPEQDEYKLKNYYYYQITSSFLYIDSPTIAKYRIKEDPYIVSDICYTFDK